MADALQRELLEALGSLSLEHQNARASAGELEATGSPADADGLRAAFDELVARVARRGRGRMPHLSTADAERQARAVLLELVRGLVGEGELPRGLDRLLAGGTLRR